MTAIILCTPKVLLQNTAMEWRNATGGDAVLVTGKPDTSVIAECTSIAEAAFRHTEYLKSYETSDLVETVALDLAKKYNITAILSFSEVDVLRAARLRERLGIGGQTAADGEYFRNKIIMKRRAWERGIEIPRFAHLTCGADLNDFVAANRLPVVVKPYDGRGSAGVEVLRTKEAVDQFLASGSASSGGFTVEEFVEGDMYRVDGLYVHGQPAVIHAARYFKDCLAFIGGETIGTHALDHDNPLNDRIRVFTRNLLEGALPFPKTSIFHLQIFHTLDDRLVLCEVASRLGGGVINEEVKLATGVDIKMSYVRTGTSQIDVPAAIGPALISSARIIIPPKTAVLRKLPEKCDFDWVEIYRTYGVLGRNYGGPAMTNAEIASFVFRGDSEIHLQERARELENWFNAGTEWIQ